MSEELRPCPFCDVNEWKYQSHFSGTTIYQCEKCGTIVEEWVINTRPIEDALQARIAELEEENDRLQDTWFVEETICPDGSLKPKVSALLSRIAELEAENETIISDYEERMDNLVNIGNETGRLLQAEIGYLNAQLGIKNLTTKTLQLRIAELEAAQRWIPVSERLPEIGVRVLFYNNFIKNIHKGWYSGDEWTSDIGIFYNGYKLKRITHWMPLPQPPEAK